MVELYIDKQYNTICIEFDLDDHYAVPLQYGYSYMYDKYHNIIGISTAYKKSNQSELVQILTSLYNKLTNPEYTEDYDSNYEELSADAYGSDHESD
jgi:hypothetical protein